jgi:hypothetical protein
VVTEAERKKRRAKDQRSAKIGLFLESEKQAACDEVENRERDIDSPRAVRLEGLLIAWVYVEAIPSKAVTDDEGEFTYCGFVYLTAAGYDMVERPWSPNV